MNLSDFEERKSTLVCKRCRGVGLETYKQPNAHGIGARCPKCGSKSPLAPEIWFKQERSVKKSEPVFEKFGEFRDIVFISSNGTQFSVNFDPKIIPKLTSRRIEECVTALRAAFYDVRLDLRKEDIP